jgi:EpsI family protein
MSRFASFVPSGVIAVGVLLIAGIREQYALPPRAALRSVNLSVAGEHVSDISVPADEQRVAGMTDYIMRAFGPDSSPVVTVYVGYYDRQVQGKAIHSPKNCLPGAGWDILESSRIDRPAGRVGERVNRVLLSNRGARALVYYWYQGRGRIEASEYLVKWNLLSDAARFGRTEEALVRIVVPLRGVPDDEISREVSRADQLASSVSIDLAKEVSRVMPLAP